MKRLFRMGKYSKLKRLNEQANVDSQNRSKEKIEEGIPTSIKILEEKLRQTFTDSSDFVLKEILTKGKDVKIIIAYIDGLVDKRVLNQDIIQAIIRNRQEILETIDQDDKNLFNLIKYNILYDCEIEDTKDYPASVSDILSGNSLLFIEGEAIALKLCTKGWQQRGIEMPETEAVVRGPREGFTESIRVNTSMLRRKIKNPNLKFEQLKLGQETNTDICMCYLKDIANDAIVDEVRRRLTEIKTDAILESGYIEEFIEDSPYSIFPTIFNSEKPDVIASKILEGRVAVICDGTPFVLTMPHLYLENIQSSEDYYSRFYFSSFARILRFISLVITSTLPAIYVAFLSFHLGAIPFELLLSMAASREGVPFSSFMEAFYMIFAFELLREAGVRMPRAVGQAVSIVGALILGDAAVNAGIASNILIIVIAITAITSFIVPDLKGSNIYIRLALLIGANVLGLMGFALVLFTIVAHMCSLRSFGVPYMSPFAPVSTIDLKDSLIRLHHEKMYTRPRTIIWNNKFK